MTADRRLGWLAILAGGALALAVQVAAPVGVPLYDGVVVQEPYRYLQPTGDQAGSPTSFSSTPAVSDGISPVVVAATTESPPQAQMIAQEGAFVLTPSATGLQVSVVPIEAPPAPHGANIAGNVYRFSVTDQAGTSLAISDCDGCISLVMRAPEGIGGASIQRFADGTWVPVETIHAGMVALYQTNPTALGDYAVITTEELAEEGIDPLIIAGGAILFLLVAAAAFLLFLVPQAPKGPSGPDGGGAGASGGHGSTRIPSKRKPQRRSSSGRSSL